MTKKVATYNHGVPWEDGFGVTQGYSVNGTIYISGQFAHDMQGAFVGEGDFEAQARQTLENLDRVLAGFNVTRANLAEMVIYLTNPREHFERCVALFKEYIGHHRPAGTLIGVSGLAFPHQLIEVRAVAHTLTSARGGDRGRRGGADMRVTDHSPTPPSMPMPLRAAAPCPLALRGRVGRLCSARTTAARRATKGACAI